MKEEMKSFTIKLSLKQDNWIKTQGKENYTSKNGYIKKLIDEDMRLKGDEWKNER